MTDIVERLRSLAVFLPHELASDAADEIERLRAALRAIIDHYDADLGSPPWTVTVIEDARKLVKPSP